jgi:hypothetical protein
MAWRLDTADQVAYGHISQGITQFCFSSVIRDVLKVNGTARIGSCVCSQDLWQARAVGLPSWIAEFRSTPREPIFSTKYKGSP